MILFGIDLSQVEARIQLMLAAGVPGFYGTDIGKECIRLATAHPMEFDIHRWVAAVALGKSEADISDEPTKDGPSERQIGKFTGYGWLRGMGADTMSNQILKAGFAVTPETCQRRLDKLNIRLPAIKDGFFRDVQEQVLRYRGLGTTWGAIWRCDWQPLGEELYGVAYSFPPVHEARDLINQEGFIPLDAAIERRKLKPHATRPTPRIHVHGHDSLLVSVHPDDAWDVACFIDRTLGSSVRRYRAGDLQVPVTYQLGETWKARHEFKRLPDEKEFRDAAWDCEHYAQAYNVAS